MVHLITYDLKSPNDTSADYERVIDAIKSTYGNWCHLEKSVWLISTPQDASEVRDSIKEALYPTDILFVSRLSGNWASFNLSARRVQWMKDRTF
jgi:hypothetical protein